MKPPSSSIAVVCVLFLIATGTSYAQEKHEAIARYEAFLAAARAGAIDEARKLVEPVPKEAEPMLQAGLRLHVADVRLKSELTSQFGLPGPKDEDEFAERAIAPAVLKSLQADVRNENAAVIHSRDPDRKAKIMLMVMVRRNGTWFAAAEMLTDQMLDDLQANPEHTFKTPPAKERKLFIEYAEQMTKVMETLHAGLKRKQFKTRADVIKAAAGLMPKADGEIDTDEC